MIETVDLHPYALNQLKREVQRGKDYLQQRYDLGNATETVTLNMFSEIFHLIERIERDGLIHRSCPWYTDEEIARFDALNEFYSRKAREEEAYAQYQEYGGDW